jgi:HNH endonuclease
MKSAGLLNSIVGHGAPTPTDSNAIKERQPMNIYRRIYTEHFGSIPKDENGKTFHIHHKDGDRNNNHPSNLIALSEQDHYDLHLKQGDYGACQKLAISMNMSSENISELARKYAYERVEKGTHPFLDSEIQRQNVKKYNDRAFSDGSHPFLRKNFSSNIQKKRVENKTHPFIGGDIQSDTWLITFPDGHKEEIINLKDFCREHNLDYFNIRRRKKPKNGYLAIKI